MGYVYRHVRLDKNEVFYVGISLLDDPKYKRAYSRADRRNQHWKSIINNTQYRVDITMENLSTEETYEKEKEFIALYGRKDLGTGTLVNFTDGGEGMLGYRHTEEYKMAASERMKGENNPNFGKTPSQETIEKHRLSRAGYVTTDETKEKIRQSKLGDKNPNWGKLPSDETRERMRIAQTGRKHSEESLIKMSVKQLGELNHNYGKKASCELRAKLSAIRKGTKMGADNPNSKIVLNKETGIFYGSAAEAYRESNLKMSKDRFYSMLCGKLKNKTIFVYT